MKRNAKIISLILTAAICISALIFTSAADPPNPAHGELVVTSKSGETGNTVLIDVRFENNPGIIGYHLELIYNPNVLKLTKVTPSTETLMTDEMFSFPMVPNVINSHIDGELEVILSAQANSKRQDGVLFTVEFQVLAGLLGSDLILTNKGMGRISAGGREDLNPVITNGTFTRDTGKIEEKAEEVLGGAADIINNIIPDDHDPEDLIVLEEAAIANIQEAIDTIVSDLINDAIGGAENLAAAIMESAAEGEPSQAAQILKQLEALEEMLQQTVAFNVDLPDLQRDEELLEALGIATGTAAEITVVGALLNTRSDRRIRSLDITPAVVQPDIPPALIEELGISETATPISLSIELIGETVSTGVSEPIVGEKLDIPITITIPIPAGLSGEIVIFHFKSGGGIEAIIPAVNKTAGTLTFSVTSFSTFVFTHRDTGEEIVEVSSTVYTIQGELMRGVAPNTTLQQLFGNLTITGDASALYVKLFDGTIIKQGTPAATNPNVRIGTGAELRAENSDDALHIVIVYGDMTGSGTIGSADLVLLARFAAGHNVTLAHEAAGRVTANSIANGTIGSADLVRLARFAAGHNVTLGE